MMNFTAARRAREGIDTAAATRLVAMLKLEVPRMMLALRLASRNPLWTILGKHINDMIRIAKEAVILTQAQYWNAWKLENIWGHAFLRAREEIEVRFMTDHLSLQRTGPLYQVAIADATSSEGDVEIDEEDLVDPVDIIQEELIERTIL